MHHPGPPRFLHVGESVELAPRAPDPAARYRWRVVDRPDGSDASVGDAPVVHLAPDVPGTYRLEVDGPDGNHAQTVRAFPDPRRPTRFTVTAADVDGLDADETAAGTGDDPFAGVECATVYGRFNDFRMGEHYAERHGDEWVFETPLAPGDHEVLVSFDEGFDRFATADATVEGPGRPRVRLDGERDRDSVVVTATARAAPGGPAPRVEFHLDDRDALARDDVTVDGDELRVPVDALPDPVRVHALPVAGPEGAGARENDATGDPDDPNSVVRHGIADTLTVHAGAEAGGDDRAAGAVSFERPADPPDWVHDAAIYEIFVREFAGETVDTTFAELERRVPYLESLGVDVVWFTPVVASPTRHGYHVTDLFDTAADLGTRAEFESLVDALHDAGLRVVFDLVINHTSRDHPAFQLHRAGVPGYEDHYERIPAERDATGVDWAGDDAPGHYFNWERIPNVNYDSLAVREWMLDVVDEWEGVVDGFRCDVAWGVPHGFWKEVRARLKDRNPDFLLLDETVPRDAAFRENEFDVHYDTDLYDALREVGTGDAPAEALFDALADSPRYGYPDEAAHMRYVENHDEDRYATECDTRTLRPAAAATFTLPGVPMIYYGQERGVPGQRGTMRWHNGDADLTAFHRRLVALRDAHPALRAPGVDPVACTVHDGDPDRVVAYERASTDGDERLVVVLHFGEGGAAVTLDRAVETTNLLAGVDVRDGETEGDADALRVEDCAVLRVRS